MTILAENTVPQWTCWSIVFLMMLLGAFVCIIASFCEDEYYILVVGIAIAMVSGVFLSNSFNKAKEIKVTISEDYPAKALLKNYKIVDIEGEIYTLKEKENKENE